MSDYTLSAKITADAANFNKAFTDAENKIKGFSGRAQEMGSSFQAVGSKVTGVGKGMTAGITAPLVAIGGMAIKSGMQFEASMSKVASVTGATGKELDALKGSAREAGATTNKSAQEAAEALEYMGLAGWSVKDSQAALIPVLKLSSASGMELGAASDMVTDTMGVMGIETKDLGGYLDTLAETSRSSNTSVAQLGEAILSVGGTARGLGIGTDELSQSLGILANNGIKGSEAGTGLNAILANMTAPVGRAKEAMDELGISVFDSQGNFIGIEESVQLLDDSMAGMTVEQKNMYKSMIAGKGHGDTLNAMLNGLGGEYDELGNKIEGADGALEEMYDVMTDNTKGAIDRLTSSIGELGLKLYDNLQPTVESLVEWVQKLTDKFNGFSEKQQQTIVKIGLVAAAIGPLLIVFGTLLSSVGKVISFGGLLAENWDKIAGAGKFLMGGLQSTVGFIFSPAGAIMIGILAVIAIGYLIVQNWEMIKEKGMAIWETVSSYLSDTFTNISESITNFLDPMQQFFSDSWDSIATITSGVWESITTFLSSVWDNITNVFLFGIELVKSVVSLGMAAVEVAVRLPMEIIKAIIGTVWNYIGDYTMSAWNTIRETITTVTTTISGVITSVWGTIRETITTVTTAISGVVTSVWTAISTYTSGVWNTIKENTMSVWNGIKSAINTAATAISTVITGIWNSIKSYTSSVWNSIKESVSTPINAAKTSVSGAVSSIRTTVSNTFSSIRGTASSTWNGIKESMVTPINSAKTSISNAIQAIKGFFSNLVLKFPKIQLPKMPSFTKTGKFSLNPPSVPSFGVNWKASGGIATGASIVGVGEAGDEAILPLSNKSKMKPFAHAVASMMPSGSSNSHGETTNNVNVASMVVREEADINKISRELYKLIDNNRRGSGGR